MTSKTRDRLGKLYLLDPIKYAKFKCYAPTQEEKPKEEPKRKSIFRKKD